MGQIKKYKKEIERDGYQFIILVTLNYKYNSKNENYDHEIKILGGKVSDIYCYIYSDITTEKLQETFDAAIIRTNKYIDNAISPVKNEISEAEQILLDMGLNKI